jgi:phosphatidylserine decarboxylase
VYASLPLRFVSRLWGYLNSLSVPHVLRKPLFGGYSFLFGVNLNEIDAPLESYEHLGDFFYRKLKPGTREINPDASLVSPCDGRVLNFGPVVSDRVEQVKGITYSLDALLGFNPFIKEVEHTYRPKPGNSLYSCVLYLAPGDHHRFYSPTEWKAERMRHFAGELFSVSPWMASAMNNLFVLNERVALLGHWKHGLFTMTAVGATNVGSVVINNAPVH